MFNKKNYQIQYHNNKDFIFSIFDDTDVATLEYIRPTYDFLNDLDLKITKSVWPLSFNGESDYKGSHTLQDLQYGRYIRELHEYGFEIAFHGPTMVSAERQAIKKAFHIFYDIVGQFPRIYAPHSKNRENLYWGSNRFSIPFFQKLYGFISHEKEDYYQGHIKKSPYFWGDLSLCYLEYVRSFTFHEINLLNITRKITYSNPSMPFVKNFFITCDADNVEEFNALLNEKNQEKLEKERGVCIISTHFGKGFIEEGKINSQTKYLLEKIREKNGWFVPVSVALDFLKDHNINNRILYNEIFSLELKWFLHSLIRKKSTRDYCKTEIPYLLSSNTI